MAWDDTLPANSTKIRNYPTVLTDNFQAIEQGGITLKHWQVNFIDRQQVPGAPPPAATPTSATDTMIMYSNEDALTNTELFVMNDLGTIIQMTQGSPNLPAGAFAGNGEMFLPGGILIKWASFTTTNGSTIEWEGIGANQLNLTKFPNNCFNVQITSRNLSISSSVNTVTKDSFVISFSPGTRDFYVFAIGN